MKLYKVSLKSGVDYSSIKPTSLLGNVYELIFLKKEKDFDFYIRTAAQEQILRQYLVLRESEEPPVPKYYIWVRLKGEGDFYENLEYSDLLNILPLLEKGEQARFWVAIEPRLNDLFLKRSNKLKLDAQKSVFGRRKKEVLASVLESYAKDNLYLLDIKLFSDSKERLKYLFNELRQYIHTHSRKLSIELHDTKKFVDTQPRISRYEFYFKLKRRLWIDEDRLNEILKIPNPQQVPLPLSVGVSLPYSKLERKDIYIGDDLLYHEKVYLDWVDFQRHSIIYGSTGSGKSNTLEILAQELAKYGVVIFVDPNSQSARKLSQIAKFYFSITKDRPNFGINILKLPQIFADKEKNIDYQINQILQLFDKILNLVETAVNVRYILQVLLRQMYKVSDEFTFRDVYEAVIALKEGTLDLDVDDETFQKEKDLLQNMQEQSFLSILSRLKLLVDNRVFQVATSQNTLDWDKLIGETRRGLIVFDVGKSVGDIVSQTMQMIIVLSLFNYALLRDMQGKEKIPIFLIVDEAQNIAHFEFINEVLAEARKYGLHLILATQSFVRLQALAGENNARAINANTNVKLLMRLTEGMDIKELAKSVGADEEIQNALPKLSIGQGFLFLLGRPGEYTVPKFVQIRKSELEDKEGPLTKGFEPTVTGKRLTPEMINPVLSIIEEVPDVLRQRILYAVFRKDGITVTDLIADLGIKREQAMQKIMELEREGAISIEQKGRSKILHYSKGLFRLKGIVENEEGRKVAMAVLKKYYEKYVIARGKQEGEIRPDFVAIAFDATNYRPKYSETIAIEIESPNEVETHPEQVLKNMKKYLNLTFVKEVHVWTAEEVYSKLKELYDKFLQDPTIPADYKQKVKIFSIKVKKAEQAKASGQGQVAESKGQVVETKAGNGNVQGGTSETKGQVTVSNIAQNAVQTPENGQREQTETKQTITVNGLTLIVQGDIIEINGKRYKADARKLRELVGMKELIKEIYVEGSTLYYKTDIDEEIIDLAPL